MKFVHIIRICIFKSAIFMKKEGTKVRGSILADQFRMSLTYRSEQIIAISNCPSTMLGTSEEMTKHV